MSEKLLEQIAEDIVRETVNEIVEEESNSRADNNSEELQTPFVPYDMEKDLTRGDQLRREINRLCEKESVITKKLSLAKDKGMHEQAEQCRLLLQRIVIHRNRKKRELAEIDARVQKAQAVDFMERFTKEVDNMTAELEEGLFDLEPKPKSLEGSPLFVAERDYHVKAKRRSIAASFFAWFGIFGGLLAAIAYLLLVHFEKLPFNWLILSSCGAFLVLMLLVSWAFCAAAKRNRRLAEAIELEIAERQAAYEAECLEYARMIERARKISQAENFEDIAEAYAIEKEGDARRVKMKAMQKWIPDLSDPEKIKKTAKILLSITAACVAVSVAVSAKKRKKKKEKNEKTDEGRMVQTFDICCKILDRIR